MTGFDCICQSIALFENSLDGGDAGKTIRTVSELARKTGYSVYHFTRLFFAVTGQAPKDYISGRILSEAARAIEATDLSLTSIALDSGFPDYATFSRAFKKRFGIPPSRIRELHHIPFNCVARIIPREKAGTINLASREPELIRLEAKSLTGLPFFIEEGTKSFHKQWATFMSVQEMVTGRRTPEVFCQFSSWTDQETMNGMSVLCALESEAGKRQHPVFTTRNIPPATYLRFLHRGDATTLYETYQYIYRDWLATHETKPIDFWELQRYTDEGKTTEICIPVALG
jgi:AraC family transcriptional regulator